MNSFLVLLIPILLNAFFTCNAIAADEAAVLDRSKCVMFSKNQLANKVPQFRKKHRIYSESIIYSASYDLNDDGQLEYFYYLDAPGSPHCGTISLQIGCPIEIYQYNKNGKLIDISADAMYPGRDFNPLKHHNYLCVSSSNTAEWASLITNNELVHQGGGESVFQFTGTTYKFINKKD